MLKNIGLLIIFAFLLVQCKQPEKIDLSGQWTYRLDREDKGLVEKWQTLKFNDTCNLPGSLRDNGIGDIPSLETQWTGSIYDSSWFYNPAMEKYRKKDALKFPFWLTPVKHYVGTAWYQKEISIPENWKNKAVSFFFERPHWQTRIWIDSFYLGKNNSLSTPHVYRIEPGKLKPGKHLLTVCVDNSTREIDPGINSHSITDHTQGNWNGVAGKMYLSITEGSYISRVRITPHLPNNDVDVEIDFSNMSLVQNARLTVKVEGVLHQHSIESKTFIVDNSSGKLKTKFLMGEKALRWSEFSPNLYQMTLTLENENGILDIRKEIFGMRKFTVNGKHFEINGVPVFLRGTTECCVFPLTGYPPVNEEEWARIFKICKSYGLNHMRFHSYCPPEAAFIAADKAGFYLQVEGPSWTKYSVTLGDGKTIDQYLMDETKRILDTYGNHPSFCMMSYGNEPSGNYVAYLENWVDFYRAYDPRRVYTGASTGRSWAIIDNSDYIVRSPPRGLAWKDKQPESVFDYRNNTENQNRPYVTFEMGQWCAFPDLKEIDKYKGVLKARNFELFREDLSDKHMSELTNDFLMASGKLQVSCYKQEIEATLRTPNLAGFQLLSLNDFPGQGTALVGVLNAFWEEKGYVTPGEFSHFCNKVVPLARLARFTFYNTDTLVANIEVANFSGEKLENVKVEWKFSDNKNTVIKSGSFGQKNIPIGNYNKIDSVLLPLNFIKKAGQFKLEVQVGGYTNQWNVWVYPNTDKKDVSGDILVCDNLDEKAITTLKKGGKVLFLASGRVEHGKDIVQYLTPVFWNTSWFRMRPPHTTGILINDKHPVFADFPTEYYSDIQWWEVANKQPVMNLEDFPPDFRSIVQPIDTWFLNRRLAMLFETKVLGGNLMVCSIDLKEGKGPVTNQLCKSILDYMESDAFKPEQELGIEVIKELFEKRERKSWNSYVNNNP